jgi:hypothetical protein
MQGEEEIDLLTESEQEERKIEINLHEQMLRDIKMNDQSENVVEWILSDLNRLQTKK